MVLLHRTQSPANHARALEIIRQFDELEGMPEPMKHTSASNEQRRDQIFFRPCKQPPNSALSGSEGTSEILSDPPEQPDLTRAASGDSTRSYFCGYLQYNYLPIVRHEGQLEYSEHLHPGQRCLMHAYLKVLDTRSRALQHSRHTVLDLKWRLQFAKEAGA